MDNLHLKNIQIKSTPLTIFEEGVFGKLEVFLYIYHHFGSELDQTRIQATIKEYGLTHGEIASSRMLDVYTCIYFYHLFFTYISNLIFYEGCSLIKDREITNITYRKHADKVVARVSQLLDASMKNKRC